jgi:hypothetical protein
MRADVAHVTEAEMKGSAFIFIILVSAILIAGWQAPVACGSNESGALLKIQSLENRTGSPPRQLLADRTDTKDDIIYSTDPEMERAMDQQIKEEKDKEEKAWNMLQHMYLYKDVGKSPRSTQPGGGTTSQGGGTAGQN